jgi:hypothetical protein
MKTGTGLLLSALLLLFTALLPTSARAQQQPTNCSSGCYIITCNAGSCTLWRCDSGGCSFVTSWDRKVVEGPVTDSVSGQSRAKAPAWPPAVAHVTVCPPGQRCDLYELTVTEALRLGSFDNVDDLVRHRESLRRPPARQK